MANTFGSDGYHLSGCAVPVGTCITTSLHTGAIADLQGVKCTCPSDTEGGGTLPLIFKPRAGSRVEMPGLRDGSSCYQPTESAGFFQAAMVGGILSPEERVTKRVTMTCACCNQRPAVVQG
jgi:hypothetical protein